MALSHPDTDMAVSLSNPNVVCTMNSAKLLLGAFSYD